jgi:hypothetical protein
MPATNAGKLFKITWGAAFANTLLPAYPLDKATAYAEPKEGQETVKLGSGVEDAWALTEDQVLEGDVRWLTMAEWDGATGWRAFLAWARQKNVFRFYPDKDSGTYYSCYIQEPTAGPPTLEDDMTRSVHLKLRTSDDSPITGY